MIEQENKRRLEELVENCGGPDNFRRLLMDDEDDTIKPQRQVPQLTLTPELIEQLTK